MIGLACWLRAVDRYWFICHWTLEALKKIGLVYVSGRLEEPVGLGDFKLGEPKSVLSSFCEQGIELLDYHRAVDLSCLFEMRWGQIYLKVLWLVVAESEYLITIDLKDVLSSDSSWAKWWDQVGLVDEIVELILGKISSLHAFIWLRLLVLQPCLKSYHYQSWDCWR